MRATPPSPPTPVPVLTVFDAAGAKANSCSNAGMSDQPVAALIQDLKTRGLLDETLIVWCGEFGARRSARTAAGAKMSPGVTTIRMRSPCCSQAAESKAA